MQADLFGHQLPDLPEGFLYATYAVPQAMQDALLDESRMKSSLFWQSFAPDSERLVPRIAEHFRNCDVGLASKPIRRMTMMRTLAIACAATVATASFAFADSVTIHQTDPEPTNSVVIKERQDPDVIIKKKKKIVVEEQNDPDVTIKGSVNID